MKKFLALLLSLSLLAPQFAMATNMTSVAIMEQSPWSLANKISFNLDRASYLLTESSAATGAFNPTIPSASEIKNLEEIIFGILKKKSADKAYIEDLLNALRYNDAVAGGKYSRQYAKEILSAVETGRTPITNEAFLKKLPDFLRKSALELLNNGNVDFLKLVRLIQVKLNVNNQRAVALALAAEVEFAKGTIGARISSLRGTVSVYKHYSRVNKGNKVSISNMENTPKKIKAASSEIIELKRISPDTEKTMRYVLGQEQLDNISNIVKGTKDIELYLKGIKNKAVLEELIKRMKTAAPFLAAVGIFTLVFISNAEANDNDAYKQIVAQAVSSKVNLKREIAQAINTNPAAIGMVYSGDAQVKGIVEELINGNGQGIPSMETLFTSIEIWQDRLHDLTTNETVLNEYTADLKTVNEKIAAQEHAQLLKSLHKDLSMPQDNTRVEKVIIPADLLLK